MRPIRGRPGARCATILRQFFSKPRLAAALLAIFIAAFGSRICDAESVVPRREYQIKASLLFNFVQYVTWPASEFSTDNFRMCLVGSDEFGPALDRLEKGLVHGKSVQVHRYSDEDSPDLERCQAIFVSRNADVATVVKTIAQRPVLVVGETAQTLSEGGAIGVLIEGDKVVFDVNQRAALAARLDVSAKLLRMARTVITP